MRGEVRVVELVMRFDLLLAKGHRAGGGGAGLRGVRGFADGGEVAARSRGSFRFPAARHDGLVTAHGGLDPVAVVFGGVIAESRRGEGRGVPAGIAHDGGGGFGGDRQGARGA